MTQWVNTSIASLKNIALLIRKQTDENKEVAFFVRKESMSRPKTPQGNHWKCQRITAIEREQPLLAEFWRLCIYLVLNMSRLQSPTRSHFQSWKRHTSQTEGSKLLIHELRNGASKFEWTWKCLAVLWESTRDQTKKQAIEEKVIVTKNRDVYVFHSARMSWRSGGLGSGARSVLVALWYRNGAAHEPFLRAPCSWQKCRWISSWSNEVDRKYWFWQNVPRCLCFTLTTWHLS